MATFVVPINDYTNGDALSTGDWGNPITRSGTTLTVGGTAPNKTLTLFANVIGTKIFNYIPVNNNNDCEILVKFKLSSDNGKQGVAMLRYTGTSEATTAGYIASGSFISSAGQLAIDEGQTGYLYWAPWNYLANTTYWVRFRVSGTTQQAKVWTDGNAEPGSWTTAGTDAHQTSGTYNGLTNYSLATSNASDTITYYWVSFGTGGDTAPNNQPSRTQTGNARITQTVDKTQTGNSRITAITSKTQFGNARITATTTRTQIGSARVEQTVAKTQTATSRITAITSRTQFGNASIKATTTRNQTGTARIVDPLSYSMETTDTLPTDNANLSTLYDFDQIEDAKVLNESYVEIENTDGYVIHEFKNYHATQSDNIYPEWVGKTARSTVVNPIILQIYNIVTTTWETMATNNTAAAEEVITLKGHIYSGMADYYDVDGYVSFRVVQ